MHLAHDRVALMSQPCRVVRPLWSKRRDYRIKRYISVTPTRPYLFIVNLQYVRLTACINTNNHYF